MSCENDFTRGPLPEGVQFYKKFVGRNTTRYEFDASEIGRFSTGTLSGLGESALFQSGGGGKYQARAGFKGGSLEISNSLCPYVEKSLRTLNLNEEE